MPALSKNYPIEAFLEQAPTFERVEECAQWFAQYTKGMHALEIKTFTPAAIEKMLDHCVHRNDPALQKTAVALQKYVRDMGVDDQTRQHIAFAMLENFKQDVSNFNSDKRQENKKFAQSFLQQLDNNVFSAQDWWGNERLHEVRLFVTVSKITAHNIAHVLSFPWSGSARVALGDQMLQKCWDLGDPVLAQQLLENRLLRSNAIGEFLSAQSTNTTTAPSGVCSILDVFERANIAIPLGIVYKLMKMDPLPHDYILHTLKNARLDKERKNAVDSLVLGYCNTHPQLVCDILNDAQLVPEINDIVKKYVGSTNFRYLFSLLSEEQKTNSLKVLVNSFPAHVTLKNAMEFMQTVCNEVENKQDVALQLFSLFAHRDHPQLASVVQSAVIEQQLSKSSSVSAKRKM